MHKKNGQKKKSKKKPTEQKNLKLYKALMALFVANIFAFLFFSWSIYQAFYIN